MLAYAPPTKPKATYHIEKLNRITGLRNRHTKLKPIHTNSSTEITISVIEIAGTRKKEILQMNTLSSRMCGVVVAMCEGQEVVHLDFLHSTD
jgi:hypothetical protein